MDSLHSKASTGNFTNFFRNSPALPYMICIMTCTCMSQNREVKACKEKERLPFTRSTLTRSTCHKINSHEINLPQDQFNFFYVKRGHAMKLKYLMASKKLLKLYIVPPKIAQTVLKSIHTASPFLLCGCQ